MNTKTALGERHDDESFDYSSLLYATASALIPYLAAVVLVLLGGHG
jgi:hypothetical protein